MKNETKFKQMLVENSLMIFHYSGEKKAKKANNKCYYETRIQITLYRITCGIEYYHLNFPDERTGIREYFQRAFKILLPFISITFVKHIRRNF